MTTAGQSASRLTDRVSFHTLPSGPATVFPGEIYQASRNWPGQAYPKIICFHEVDKGGHLAKSRRSLRAISARRSDHCARERTEEWPAFKGTHGRTS
jgi:hypothetical protein